MAARSFFGLIEFIVRIVTNILMAANFILIITSVFCRYVLADPIIWSEELAKFMLVWMVFLAGSSAIMRWENIRVTIVEEHLSPTHAKVLDSFLKVLATVFIMYLFYLAITSIPNVWHREMAPALGIPMVVPQLGVIVGLGLMVLQCIGVLIETFKSKSAAPREGV